MRPRLNVWIEDEGEVILTLWRVRLLETVQQTGSINAAAKQMGIQFRTAWAKIHEMEERLGFPLVESQVGGAGGGGTRLTPAGEQLVLQFRELVDGLPQMLEERFNRIFSASPLTPGPLSSQDST
ncbi:MAG: LysR family transcriptional regulator [Ardenticatenia bacterium]|nr:LysR family transcriptional regulator [Ardenticatenia bacterium]